jgi:hypothetical protein
MSANEITKRIYEDLQDALSAIADNIEHPSAAIESIHVRVGERSSLIQTMDDLDPSPFSSQNGWIIDVAFSPFHLRKKGTHTFKTQSAFPLFSRLPISSIKGIGAIWAKRFQAESIRTIGDLSGADDAFIDEFCQRYNSIQAFSYRHKAVQLDQKIPFELIENFGHLNLHHLIKTQTKLISEAWTDPLLLQLIFSFFNCCANSLDAHILETLHLGRLRLD